MEESCSSQKLSENVKNGSEYVHEGNEPGASRSSDFMLIHTEPYEEINAFLHPQNSDCSNPPTDGSQDECDDDGSNKLYDLNIKGNGLEFSAETVYSNNNRNFQKNAQESDDQVQRTDEMVWRKQKRHVFVLSNAGKPIYSRHGEEDEIVTLMGLVQALAMSVIHGGEKDNILCVCAGKHKIVFLVREPLILCSVSQTCASLHQSSLHLMYVYYQIISILTASSVTNIFSRHNNYDLRRLLTGSERFLDNLVYDMDHEPCFFLSAVSCLSLEPSVRDIIIHTIVQHCKIKDLVFAVLIAGNRLVGLVRMKTYSLHPMEIHLICNFVASSESFKNNESWIPVCLPIFNKSGYMYAHVSYLDESSTDACLILFTIDNEQFYTLAECRKKIQQKLLKSGCLNAIHDSLKSKTRTSDVGISGLWHFMYKCKSTSQMIYPENEAPYQTLTEQDRLLELYMYVHQRLHSPSRPCQQLFHTGSTESILGLVTSGYELYCTFSPLVGKPLAISCADKLLRWIKKEEDRLFILQSPTI